MTMDRRDTDLALPSPAGPGLGGAAEEEGGAGVKEEEAEAGSAAEAPRPSSAPAAFEARDVRGECIGFACGWSMASVRDGPRVRRSSGAKGAAVKEVGTPGIIG